MRRRSTLSHHRKRPLRRSSPAVFDEGDVTLEDGDFGTYLLVHDDGREVLIQTDWDWPGVASNLGWRPCFCGSTDGTIDCAHKTASKMIASAGKFLDEHIGDKFPDPGYF